MALTHGIRPHRISASGQSLPCVSMSCIAQASLGDAVYFRKGSITRCWHDRSVPTAGVMRMLRWRFEYAR